MANKKGVNKIVVVLPVQTSTNTGVFILEAQHIHDLLQGNNDFPGLQNDLPPLQADINLLIADEAKVLNRVPGAAALAAEKKGEIYNQMDGLRAGVQKTVNLPANIANAVAMVQGAGMLIKGRKSTTKGALTVRQGEVSGSVDLIAKAAAKKAAYHWQQSTDNVTFTDCSSMVTLEARNTVFSLAIKTDYWFRFRAVLPAKQAKKSKSALKQKAAKKAEGNWSQSMKITVV